MKKILSIILINLLTLTLFIGCGKEKNISTNENKIENEIQNENKVEKSKKTKEELENTLKIITENAVNESKQFKYPETVLFTYGENNWYEELTPDNSYTTPPIEGWTYYRVLGTVFFKNNPEASIPEYYYFEIVFRLDNETENLYTITSKCIRKEPIE